MKILLTGATGFVGSHILDSLRARGWNVRVLLRRSSNRQFIAKHLPDIEVSEGGIGDTESLVKAMDGVTHVIHCAGATKARHNTEFDEINRIGTRNVVEAANRHAGSISRFMLISSLAASHPATASAPAREDDPPSPVSEYGRSKLGGEQEVRERCQSPFTILRPPAVFGPRDTEFLSTFRAVKRHLSPGFIGGVDTMSIVFVKDLAEAVATCLTHHAAVGRTYFVASPDVVTVCGLGDEIAKQLNVWTLPLWLPVGLLWPVCAINEVLCRLVNKPSMLNRQKYRELSAPGWVCDTTRLKAEVGFVAPTPLPVAIQQTIGWYREKEML